MIYVDIILPIAIIGMGVFFGWIHTYRFNKINQIRKQQSGDNV